MFNRKESLERKFRVVVAGVTALTGTGALVYLLNREASPVAAAEPPKPSHVEADPTFTDHLEGQYQNVRIVREPVGLDICTDTDRTEVYPDGKNPLVKEVCEQVCVSWDANCDPGCIDQGGTIDECCPESGWVCTVYQLVCHDHEVFLPLVQSSRP